MSDDGSTDGDDGPLALFDEPEGYYPPEKPPTTVTHQMKSGRELELHLVGHNPLWGHLLWQGGRVVSNYLEDHAAALMQNRNVLELGAGAGLPSLTCALHGARTVVVTDYPDAPLITNLQHNIEANIPMPPSGSRTIYAEGYLWGAETSPLTAHLDPEQDQSFDLLILADLLFNHSEHTNLLDTVCRTLRKAADSQALVFFTPYRPWLFEKDLAFFTLADGKVRTAADDAGVEEPTNAGSEAHLSPPPGDFIVTKILEHVMDRVMFEEDRGDEKLRRTVFGYSLKWRPEILERQV